MAARIIAGAPVSIAAVNSGDLTENLSALFKVDRQMAFDFCRILEVQSSAGQFMGLFPSVSAEGIARPGKKSLDNVVKKLKCLAGFWVDSGGLLSYKSTIIKKKQPPATSKFVR